ncbi:MAG: sel1 repeat family protein [Oscillospiraceae bacterium]|nr:sel1 repeat family protein [Oscillospiraceae bacterium]
MEIWVCKREDCGYRNIGEHTRCSKCDTERGGKKSAPGQSKTDIGQIEIQEIIDRAVKGDIECQYNLAIQCEEGKTVEQNYATAAAWYRSAAEHGHADAQCSLALMSLEGRGIEQSNSEAFKWFTESARQENAEAQLNLGLMYAKKTAPTLSRTSNIEALKWLKAAAEQGAEKAEDALNEARALIAEDKQKYPAIDGKWGCKIEFNGETIFDGVYEFLEDLTYNYSNAGGNEITGHYENTDKELIFPTDEEETTLEFRLNDDLLEIRADTQWLCFSRV